MFEITLRHGSEEELWKLRQNQENSDKPAFGPDRMANQNPQMIAGKEASHVKVYLTQISKW